MPERSSIKAARVSAEAIAEALASGGKVSLANGKNPYAVALGRRGGLKGGRARADSLTQRRRSEIAKMAAEARWSVKKAS